MMKLPKGTYKAVKKYLASSFFEEKADDILKATTRLYNKFIEEAQAPGGLNVLRKQYYGGLSIFAFYEVMNRDVSEDVLQDIVWSMLLGGGDIDKKQNVPINLNNKFVQKIGYDQRAGKTIGRSRRVAIHLSFACSLRVGELLGLTWDCVDISQEAVDADRPFLYINKELQRCSNESLEKLGDKGIILKFPPQVTWSTSTLVLKAPKTLSSERKVYLPQSLVKMLREHRMTQEEYIALFGEDYTDYNLVFAYPNGRPIEHAKITHLFEDLIKKHNLPPVVFHSLRHSSITYKLKLNGGDMKSVQGDSGHAQLKMVADVYSHIIDEDRSRNARLIEQEFYSGAPAAEEDQPDRTAGKTASDLETLVRLLQNPEIAELAKKLMQN